jgi:hypothetical protein
MGSPWFRSISTPTCLATEARFSAGDALHPHTHDRPILAVMLDGSFDTSIRSAAIIIITSASAFPFTNRRSRNMRAESIASAIAMATRTTFHIFPRAIQNSVTNNTPAAPVVMAFGQPNSRLKSNNSTTIKARKHRIASGSRRSCVE